MYKEYQKIINNYVYASKLFNDKYKDNYRIDIFLDFNSLNIYLRDLKENTCVKLQILNNCINEADSNVILEFYEEILNKEVLKSERR